MPLAPKGRLAENVVHFVRVLRAAGMPVGPARVLAALEAVEAVGLDEPRRFSRGARRGAGVAARAPAGVRAGVRSLLAQSEAAREADRGAAADGVRARRRAGAGAASCRRASRRRCCRPPRSSRRAPDDDEIELDAAFTMSPREVLQHKDFETMTAEELAAVRVMLRDLRLPLPELPTRRTDAVASAATGSTCARRCAARPAPRARCRRSPGGSGSGARRRSSCSATSRARWTATRACCCTSCTRSPTTATACTCCCSARGSPTSRATCKHRDVDVALARVTAAVSDWAGGTRIGSCLEEFNRRWSRRLLGQNAVVLLISDGLDADAGDGLGRADGAPRASPAGGSSGSIRCCATRASRRGRRASGRCCRTSTISCRCTTSRA